MAAYRVVSEEAVKQIVRKWKYKRMEELEFREHARARMIEKVTVVRNIDGYGLLVDLKSTRSKYALCVARRGPRIWRKLDSLVKFFDENGLKLKVFTVQR